MLDENAFKSLIDDIEGFGYRASYMQATIEVKSDMQDDECIAILWLKDSTVMADMGNKQLEICDLTDFNRKEALENFLDDPWNWRKSK